MLVFDIPAGYTYILVGMGVRQSRVRPTITTSVLSPRNTTREHAIEEPTDNAAAALKRAERRIFIVRIKILLANISVH